MKIVETNLFDEKQEIKKKIIKQNKKKQQKNGRKAIANIR